MGHFILAGRTEQWQLLQLGGENGSDGIPCKFCFLIPPSSAQDMLFSVALCRTERVALIKYHRLSNFACKCVC